MKTKLLLLFSILSINCFAQFSKTHYIPPLCNPNPASTYATGDQYLYISCPSITDVNYTIRAIGGATISGVVRRDDPQSILIGNGSDTQLLANGTSISTVLNNKGYVIEAENQVYVTVRLAAAITASGTPNHAGGLVSKGLAALGTKFRIGAFVNTGVTTDERHNTFASILATENNTVISFSDIKPGVQLSNNAAAGNTPANITLNSGESYIIAAQGPNGANADGLIGALISSDKPIAVNCGSFGGSNGDASNSSDIGFDQIVSAERTGDEYIFIKGENIDIVERPLIVAHENNTEVFLNGSTIPTAILNAGQYLALNGSQFSAVGNLYINTSKNVFAYQGIGGTSQANQNMHFLPPLGCETPKVVNNIPFINTIGTQNFAGTVCIVTETGASLNFIINGITYTSATLPGGVIFAGPFNVAGNAAYVTYKIRGLTGNISVISTKSVYVSYYSSSGAATYGGFYSGFIFKPEVTQDAIAVGQTNCIPNATLSLSSISSFDAFEWYLNGVVIPGAISNTYTPIQPGYYNVKGTITACNTIIFSDKIPVSSCPTNIDGDLANDNIDIDNDNDGITNCLESYGNQAINTVLTSGTIPQSTTTYIGTVTTSATPAPIPFVGNVDGSFVSELLPGKTNSNEYEIVFSQPTNVSLEYVTTANAADLLNSNSEYVVNSSINKTITLLNPTNQLLIDTNYDGVYESGITTYSSFEIRFRLNSAAPLAAGAGNFRFLSHQTDSFKITHRNLSTLTPNKTTFKILATCLPFDTDGDSNPNQTDTDSDNDGILDSIEAQGTTPLVLLNADTNLNGLDNAFEPGLVAVDTDLDGVFDYLDLDSDNDGILDLNEGVADTDADGIKNYRELDSDNDLCFDVKEAGFLDPNNDGILGATTPPSINTNGQVTSGTGYTAPNGNYILFAPIVITTQPTVAATCELENATISLVDNGGNTYQWQLSTDSGATWTNLTNVAPYSNVTTNTLNLTPVTNSMNAYQYRVVLNKVGNSCGLISAATTLTVFAKPIVNDVTIIQCDDDLDLLTLFDLTDKNSQISSNTSNTFTYYTSAIGASTANATFLIDPETAFPNTTSPMQVWARVVDTNGCYGVATITLIASASQIPSSYSFIVPPVCDDELAANGSATGNPETNKRDGITSFNLTAAIADVERQLPPPLSNYTIKYYRNEVDALAQNLAIAPTEYANFRNDIPNNQDIWVRINNSVGNCPGFGAFIKLSVEKLPIANSVTVFKECDDNQDRILAFNTTNLESTLIGTNQSTTIPYTIQYFEVDGITPLRDSNNVLITSPFPASFSTISKDIVAIITNSTTQACFDKTTIKFIVDFKPADFTIAATNLNQCDDEADPKDQNGIFNFTSSAAIHSAIQNAQPVGMNSIIKYFDGLTLLSSPLPNPLTVNVSQTITVVVENADNLNCTFSKSIEFKVNPTPKINLIGDELVCDDNLAVSVTIDAGFLDNSNTSDYDYLWKLAGNLIPFTTYSININIPGIYTVDVINKITGCTKTRTITVVASNKAKTIDVVVSDLTDNNTITVNVTGDGDYVYSIESEVGPYQESNVFADVKAGVYTVWVKDMNGCGIKDASFNVLGAPKYFTPNGDGYNDTWNVKGISSNFNSKSIIYIYNRFGKLLKQVTPLGSGWNGTFNGQEMPADDYWYTVEFEDGRNIKGHFALKR